MESKKFDRIVLVVKHNLVLDATILDKIKGYFSGKRLDVVKFSDLRKMHLHDCDLVITLGGDGTFIKAGNLIKDAYILGINAEPKTSEGALTTLNINEVDKIGDVLAGKFKIRLAQRATAKLNGNVLDEQAINEVYVGSASQFHSSRYKIRFNGLEEEQRSSGVLIATGNGSAAWFFSAGGKVFNAEEEKLSFVVREPYFGKRVFMPKILKGDILKEEKIEIESMRNFGGVIAINDSVFSFNKGDVLEVFLSEFPLHVVVPD
jgi:NAD kinase